MKRERRVSDIEIDPYECYKMQHVLEESIKEYESIHKWLYIGANAQDGSFAKIGVTMGDLTSRSYSSTDPYYYLFCAFKCRYNITESILSDVEAKLLVYLDDVFPNKRVKHFESGRPSECFYNIDFESFFANVHYYLYNNHCNKFIKVGYMDKDNVETEFSMLDCEYNRNLMDNNTIDYYMNKILML